jgi:hypothetical protein
MKKLLHLMGFMVLLVMIAVSVSNAQGKLGVVGKIFSKPEAKTLFGKVIGSITIDKKELQQALSKAGDYVLLAVTNNRLVVCNEKKQLLNGSSYVLDKNQQMYVFSTSMVQKLLQPKVAAKTLDVSSAALSTSSSAISVEVRAGVLTLSSETETLEFSMICPPICFD